MLEIKDTILTHDVSDKGKGIKEILLSDMLTPDNIVDFTFPMGTFMLNKPESAPQKPFGIFSLGKVLGGLGRKDLYDDR